MEELAFSYVASHGLNSDDDCVRPLAEMFLRSMS